MSQQITWESIDSRIEKKMKLVSQISRLQTHAKFMTAIFIVIVTALIFIVGLTFNINAKLSTVQTDVSTLKADVSTLKADVSTLQADVSTLQVDMTLVKRKLEIE